MSTLTQLRSEWNALVPMAQARGLRGVHVLRSNHETIAAGERRLAWLRAKLNGSAAVAVASPEDWTFGVEIECLVTVSHEDVAAAVRAEGVECNAEMYNHSTRAAWKVVSDGSVHDNSRSLSRGCELVSPVLRGQAGIESIRKVCAALERIGARINTTCGLHIHVGARGQSLDFFKNLVRLYAQFQGVIDTTLPVSRRANTYCQPMSEGDVRAAERCSTIDQLQYAIGSRYRKLNLQSYWRHGTVEFRHHSGTTEAVKIEAWLKLVLGLCVAARAGRTGEATLAGLAEVTGADRGYLEQRAARFAA